jgi:Predicted methyltransferase regulatory domain
MNFSPTFSPAPLSYMAALRGVNPRGAGTSFTYAVVNCTTPNLLMALAASNPEGQFYGLMNNAEVCREAAQEALMRQVTNVSFLHATPADALAWFEKKSYQIPSLDYLCCDESEKPLSASERATIFDLAAKALKNSGLLSINYRSYAEEDGALRFLVKEFSPEMSPGQACEFLLELKKLGTFFFKQHASLAAKLDQAIIHNMPDEFFALFEDGEAQSKTFDTIVAMGARGFTYAGDSSAPANYVELSVPVEAQQIIVTCRDNPLYEPLKDFAQNRNTRSDIWCKQPAATSSDLAQLFGSFSYGITLPRGRVPVEIEVQGKTVPLDSPLYATLIELMSMMPVGIGDILSRPEGKSFKADEIVGAVQILVACGIARPMRGMYRLENMNDLVQPRFVGTFNRYLETTSLTGNSVSLASQALGDVMTISLRDALVMQALNRVGLADSVSALLPELERLAQNPSQAARIMDGEPTAESAKQMIEDVVSESILQWYAYGLLEAA